MEKKIEGLDSVIHSENWLLPNSDTFLNTDIPSIHYCLPLDQGTDAWMQTSSLTPLVVNSLVFSLAAFTVREGGDGKLDLSFGDIPF